ncbi:hypothetical protein DIPPA_15199 [Diplonema papillatum]|nr:hypothetical protein DIPPA_15199 [Diplonema papillatum]
MRNFPSGVCHGNDTTAKKQPQQPRSACREARVGCLLRLREQRKSEQLQQRVEQRERGAQRVVPPRADAGAPGAGEGGGVAARVAAGRRLEVAVAGARPAAGGRRQPPRFH